MLVGRRHVPVEGIVLGITQRRQQTVPSPPLATKHVVEFGQCIWRQISPRRKLKANWSQSEEPMCIVVSRGRDRRVLSADSISPKYQVHSIRQYAGPPSTPSRRWQRYPSPSASGTIE